MSDQGSIVNQALYDQCKFFHCQMLCQVIDVLLDCASMYFRMLFTSQYWARADHKSGSQQTSQGFSWGMNITDSFLATPGKATQHTLTLATIAKLSAASEPPKAPPGKPRTSRQVGNNPATQHSGSLLGASTQDRSGSHASRSFGNQDHSGSQASRSFGNQDCSGSHASRSFGNQDRSGSHASRSFGNVPRKLHSLFICFAYFLHCRLGSDHWWFYKRSPFPDISTTPVVSLVKPINTALYSHILSSYPEPHAATRPNYPIQAVAPAATSQDVPSAPHPAHPSAVTSLAPAAATSNVAAPTGYYGPATYHTDAYPIQPVATAAPAAAANDAHYTDAPHYPPLPTGTQYHPSVDPVPSVGFDTAAGGYLPSEHLPSEHAPSEHLPSGYSTVYFLPGGHLARLGPGEE